MSDLEKVKISQNSETKRLREEKERLAEIKNFNNLCVDYHKSHDKGWDMSSYEQDKSLLKRFEKVKVDLLPVELKYVYYHRLAYVRAIAKLGSNDQIKQFALKFQFKLGSDSLATSDSYKLYENVKDSEEFKSLTNNDFNYAKKVLNGAIKLLSAIPGNGNWGDKAAQIITNDHIDDQMACRRLNKGFNLILNNVQALQKRKEDNA